MVCFSLGSAFIERHHLVHLLRQFNLDEENNVPNWYHSCAYSSPPASSRENISTWPK